MTMRLVRTICVVLALAVCGAAAQVSQIVLAPVADHHVHLRSLAVNALFTDGLPVIDVPADVQTLLHIAHLAGWGGYGPETEAAFGVFADAIAAGDPRVANLYFDIAAIVAGTSPDQKAAIVRRLRQIGMSRVLFAIDGPVTRAPWELFRTLPLTEAEFQIVATNLAPYMPHRSK